VQLTKFGNLSKKVASLLMVVVIAVMLVDAILVWLQSSDGIK